MNASPAKKAPAYSPRIITTVGRPRAKRSEPAGSSRRRAGKNSASPTAAMHDALRPAQQTALLQQRQTERRDEREPHPAATRRAVAEAAAEPGQPRAHEQQRRDHERHDEPEHRTPRHVVGQEACDDRPDDRRQHPRRREQREDLGAQRIGVGAADDDVDRHDADAAAEALQHARTHEHGHRPGRAREQGTEAEQRDARDERPARAGAIAPLPRDHHADEARDHVAVERPRVGAEPVERLRDHGHRRGDADALEGEHRHDRDDADRHGAVRRGQHALRTRCAGRGRGVGCGGCAVGRGQDPDPSPPEPPLSERSGMPS